MTKRRFISSVVKAAKQETTQMAWARGSQRVVFATKRKSPADQSKAA